jgi:arginyl-tRNA synthetase
MEYKEIIIRSLREATGQKDIHLEKPENEEYGDYSSNIAMAMFSKTPKSQNSKTSSKLEISKFKTSRELAVVIVRELKKDGELMKVIEKIGVAGPAFINFHLAKTVFVNNITKILKDTERYGSSDVLKGKNIMVEFAHPNTHKEFHIGHLRNIVLAESIIRLLEAVDAKVIRANYQGDVGLHIAKALWGVKKLGFTDPKDARKRVNFLGKAYAAGSTAYEEHKEAKKEIQVINKKIYSKEDKEISKLYEATRKWSLDYFDSIYKRVYSKFDRLYFEGECMGTGKEYALDGLKKGILEESKGAIIFPGSKYGLHDRVFITGAGVPTYEAKDFGLVKLQLAEYNPDLIIHVLGPEQLGYTEVIFKAQELLFPETKGGQLHVPYGWVRLKKGKMSSRSGKVVLGETLLDEAKKLVIQKHKTKTDIAEQIAVGAVKYSFLKVAREQEIVFDMEESLSLQGNSGPYLQYTFARTQSVLAKLKTKNEKLRTKTQSLKLDDYNLNKEELSLMRTFVHFPEVVQEAGEKYSPNLICNYLFDLAQRFNTFYNSHRILEGKSRRVEEHESKSHSGAKQSGAIESQTDTVSDLKVQNFRITLTKATGQILKNGLNLLGIKAPERM